MRDARLGPSIPTDRGSHMKSPQFRQLDACTHEAFRPRLALTRDESAWKHADPIDPWERRSESDWGGACPALQRELGNLARDAWRELAEPDPNLSPLGVQGKRRKVAAGYLAKLHATTVDSIGGRIGLAVGQVNQAENALRRDTEEARNAISPLALARAEASAALVLRDDEIRKLLLDEIEKGDPEAIEAALLLPGYGSTTNIRKAAERHFSGRVVGGLDRVRFVEARAVMRDVLGWHLECVRHGLELIAQTGELPKGLDDLSAAELIARGNEDGDLDRRAKALGICDVRPRAITLGKDGRTGWEQLNRDVRSSSSEPGALPSAAELILRGNRGGAA
ncbi:MAG: hypothetical protein KDC98_18840 [Planctomycetes bacterium]|nr:hypothetical protein [Planctomycetota bacterium]